MNRTGGVNRTGGTIREGCGGRSRVLLSALLLLAGALAASCDLLEVPGLSSSEEDSTIDRETFVSAYVDLRLAALRSPEGTISADRREEVLRRHGVEREDLLRFVEVHGERAGFMREVWAEAEERIERAREAGDSVAGGGLSPRSPVAGPDGRATPARALAVS